MKSLQRMARFYDKLEEVLLVASITVSVLLLFANVVLRYLFNSSIYGVDEIARILFIWMSWLGISIGERKNEHIVIDILSNKLKGKAHTALQIVSQLITLGILATLTGLGIIVVNRYMRMGALSPMWHIPNWFIYTSLPVGCAVMSIRLLVKIVKTVVPAKKGWEEFE